MSTKELIANRYEVQASLGEGGMGAVVKAHDSLLEITVAIKQLHQDTRQETVLRFQTEAMALAKLNHRNIVKILDFAQDSNSTYMVMEFLDGDNLASLIERSRLSVIEALEIFVDICDALAHAHKNGVLHRDLKPSNIVLVTDDMGVRYAKVVDFGIARLEQREPPEGGKQPEGRKQGLTGTGVGIGSPIYMSPEQITNTDVDPRSDIYSFGCVMFEALRGFPPLKGETALETAQKHLLEEAPSLSHKWKGEQFPTALVDVVAKCLRKKPEERSQSFSELQITLAELLEQLLSEADDTADSATGNTLETGKVEVGIVPKPRTTKQKMLLSLAAVAGLIIVGAFVIMAIVPDRKEQLVSSIKVKESFSPANAISGPLPNADGLSSLETETLSKDVDSIVSNPVPTPASDRIKFSPDRGGCNIKQATVKDIEKLVHSTPTKVHTLIISNSELDADILSAIAKLKLNVLTIHLCSMTPEAKIGLIKLDTIRNLSLKRCDDITDADLLALDKFKNLKTLDLVSLQHVTNAGITNISRRGGLDLLILDSLPINDDCIPDLIKMQNLKCLGLVKNENITESGLKTLLSSKKLEAFLYTPIGPSEMQGDGVVTALGNSKTQSVIFDYISITADQLIKLCANKELRLLKLELPTINSRAITALDTLPNLHTLKIAGTRNLTDEYIKQMSKLRLKTIVFDACNLTNTHVKLLKQVKSLHVEVEHCPATPTARDLQ